MSDHTPWAEVDADGMWEASCRDCGVLAGPPFYVLLRRYDTEDEAYAAASSVLSMIAGGCQDIPEDVVDDVVAKARLMSWVQGVSEWLTAALIGSLLVVLGAGILIGSEIGWTAATGVLFAMVCAIPIGVAIVKFLIWDWGVRDIAEKARLE